MKELLSALGRRWMSNGGRGWSERLNIGLWQLPRILKDRLSLAVLLAAAGVNGLSLILLLAHLSNAHANIPTHYSSLTGFEGLGGWSGPLMIALFGVAVTVINFGLAALAFGRSRLVSFFLLTSAVATGLFCLIIANAFAMVTQ